MVCLGNICRSPLAEGIMQQLINDNNLPWQVDSVGTNGLHNGQAPHPLSQQVGLLYNINISKQCSKQLLLTDADNYDIILAMAADVVADIKKIFMKKYSANKVKLFTNYIPNSKSTDVPDPYYGGIEGYHHMYDLLKAGCDNFVKLYYNKTVL